MASLASVAVLCLLCLLGCARAQNLNPQGFDLGYPTGASYLASQIGATLAAIPSGFYDVQCIGRASDYCRWVGCTGCTGTSPIFDGIWWSCALGAVPEGQTITPAQIGHGASFHGTTELTSHYGADAVDPTNMPSLKDQACSCSALPATKGIYSYDPTIATLCQWCVNNNAWKGSAATILKACVSCAASKPATVSPKAERAAVPYGPIKACYNCLTNEAFSVYPKCYDCKNSYTAGAPKTATACVNCVANSRGSSTFTPTTCVNCATQGKWYDAGANGGTGGCVAIPDWVPIEPY